ncbi:MAG: hypothetical protein ABI968_04280 [Acidobacteriota bacterium]
MGFSPRGGRVSAEGERSRRTALRWTVLGFAALTILFSGTFPPFANPNELSRIEMVVAAADLSTFAIDPVLHRLGDHEDKSIADGKTYSNKAPGLALAAIPVYRLLRAALPSPSRPSEPIVPILRFLTVSLVCALALARLGRRLSAQANPAVAPLIVAAVAFGTPFLFYGRSFFAHAWTAALLFLSWDLLRVCEERRAIRRMGLWVVAAGFLAGWAVISEYSLAPVALLLCLRAAAHRTWRTAGFFGFGAAIALAILAVYNAICFGSPWVLSSAREAYPAYNQLSAQGLFGFGPPSARIAAAYLFHPARGILLFSPFLLWSIPGFLRWWRSRENRPDCAFCLAGTSLFFVVMTGYPNWHGGWSLGNRYLLPVVFFPALAIGYALATPLSRGLFAASVVLAAATHLVLTSSWPYFPENVPWPAATGSGWFLARGWIAPGLWDGIPGGAGLALAIAALAVAVPLVLALRCAAPTSPRPAVAALLGLAPLVALLLRPPELTFDGRLWRAAIYGSYSGRDAERSELRAVALSAATPEEQRRAMGAWRAYGPR